MITIVSSTNRKSSVSKLVAQTYEQLLKDRQVAADLISLEVLPADFVFTALYDRAGQHETFNALRAQMEATEKFIFIVPEYNGSFPGVLKAFIDGLRFPDTFTDKKTALVGVSAGMQGAGLALSHLTDIFHYCGMNVLANKPKLFHIEQHMADQRLSDRYQALLERQIEKFLKF